MLQAKLLEQLSNFLLKLNEYSKDILIKNCYLHNYAAAWIHQEHKNCRATASKQFQFNHSQKYTSEHEHHETLFYCMYSLASQTCRKENVEGDIFSHIKVEMNWHLNSFDAHSSARKRSLVR